MKEITTSKGTFLFIQCPSDIKKYWIHFDGSSGQTRVANDSKNGWTVWEHVLEDGLAIKKYEIISTTKEISEEMTKSIVENPELGWYLTYTKGNIDSFFCQTAKESFQSLLNANELKQPNYLILKKL